MVPFLQLILFRDSQSESLGMAPIVSFTMSGFKQDDMGEAAASREVYAFIIQESYAWSIISISYVQLCSCWNEGIFNKIPFLCPKMIYDKCKYSVSKST